MTADELKALVALAIKANGNREITGPVLQAELFRIIDATYDNTADTVSGSLDVDPDNILDPAFIRQNAPPATPSTGDRYVVGTVPSGAWEGHADEIAEWSGAAWQFALPVEGNIIHLTTPFITLEYLDTTGWRTYPGIAVRHNGQGMGTAGLRIGTRNARNVTWLTNSVGRMTLGTDGVLSYLSDVSASFTDPQDIPDVGYVQGLISAGAVTAGNGLTDNAGVFDLGGQIAAGTEVLLPFQDYSYFEMYANPYLSYVGYYPYDGLGSTTFGVRSGNAFLEVFDSGVSLRSGAGALTMTEAGGATYFSTLSPVGDYGIMYAADLEATLQPLSLIHKSAVESLIAASAVTAGSGLTDNAGAFDLGGGIAGSVDLVMPSGTANYFALADLNYTGFLYLDTNDTGVGFGGSQLGAGSADFSIAAYMGNQGDGTSYIVNTNSLTGRSIQADFRSDAFNPYALTYSNSNTGAAARHLVSAQGAHVFEFDDEFRLDNGPLGHFAVGQSGYEMLTANDGAGLPNSYIRTLGTQDGGYTKIQNDAGVIISTAELVLSSIVNFPFLSSAPAPTVGMPAVATQYWGDPNGDLREPDAWIAIQRNGVNGRVPWYAI